MLYRSTGMFRPQPEEKIMKLANLTLTAAVAALAGTWGIQSLNAQQPGLTRVPLQDVQLSAPGRHAVQARGEFSPGGAVGRHTHPGEEVSYVLEGTLQLEVDGQPPRTLKAGEAFSIPAGVVHAAKNIDSGSTKVLSTYIVEIGKPVATPVQ
jgi:quercetin dioxygenase-like cupin family protein